MRHDVLVIAAVAGVVYANDPAPVAFDAGEWYVHISALLYSASQSCHRDDDGLPWCS